MSEEKKERHVLGDCPAKGCNGLLIVREKETLFMACTNFPNCLYRAPFPKRILALKAETPSCCPQCGSELLELDSRYGKYLGCEDYPYCRFKMPLAQAQDQMIQIKAMQEEMDKAPKCPECGGYLLRIWGQYGDFLGCTSYPKCRHKESFVKE